MAGHTKSNDVGGIAETVSQSQSPIPRAATWAVWGLFLLALGVLSLSVAGGSEWRVPGLFVVDGLTTVMWVVVAFFSGIVHSYSRRYMAGDGNVERFYAMIFSFTLVVMATTAADHVALFVGGWLGMGLLMAGLIGHVRGWEQARAAGRLARRYFIASSGLLAAGLAVLAWTTGASTVSGIVGNVGAVPQWAGLLAMACLLLAAMIQSALYPFQGWLLSSMTAPTPASALMHAGFVNAGGILLTRFAPVFSSEAAVMSVVVIVGAASALLGQAMLLVQTDIKRKLGSSTVAQMGFMILQCGLGFFAAAITHLVLHGFYKAYLFLSSGANVEQTSTKTKSADASVLNVVVGLLTAVGGGLLFAALTGKGTHLDSGLVLTAVVVLTTLHATRDILRRSMLPSWLRLLSTPVIVLAAIGTYAASFNAISELLAGVPATTAATDLTVVHGVVIAAFAGLYLVTELGLHRSSKRLYVALLNVSQPDPTTVLTTTEEYNDA